MRVSAVVVSYNVRELLLECIRSVDEARRAGVLDEVIVVDNASSDGSAHAVRNHFPDVHVIDAPNRGYGAGANRGIAASCGKYVLVLNPDTVVPQATIAGLASHLDAYPSAAVAAPRMRYADGTIQPSRRRFPRKVTPVFESTIFERWWPDNRWAYAYHLRDRPEDVIQQVDWVVGACMLVRRDAIDRAGGFDESFWLYCEEIEWCWRFQHHGWTVDYVPTVEIVHHEGMSTGQDVSRRQITFDRSRVELQRRLYGKPVALLVASGIRLGYLAQLLTEILKFALGHKRELRKARIRFYVRMFRSSLRFDSNPPS